MNILNPLNHSEIFGFGKQLYERGRNGLFIGDYGLKAKHLYDNGIHPRENLNLLADYKILESEFRQEN